MPNRGFAIFFCQVVAVLGSHGGAPRIIKVLVVDRNNINDSNIHDNSDNGSICYVYCCSYWYKHVKRSTPIHIPEITALNRRRWL